MHEPISKGVETALMPGIVDTTNCLGSLYESQQLLTSELERLETKLTSFAESSQCVDLKSARDKLQSAEKRLYAINTLLKQVRNRLNTILTEMPR